MTFHFIRYCALASFVLGLASLFYLAESSFAAPPDGPDAASEPSDLSSYLLQSEAITRPIIQRLQQQEAPLFTPAELVRLQGDLEKLDPTDLFRGLITTQHLSGQLNRSTSRAYQRMLKNTLKRLSKAGDGSPERPVPVRTSAEAFAYAHLTGARVQGGLYQAHVKAYLYLILFVTRGDEAHQEELYFSLGAPAADSKANRQATKPLKAEALIARLAQANDAWAMATVGSSLGHQAELKDKALFWLQSAHQRGNLVATLLLAKLHLQIDSQTNHEDQPRPHRKAARSLYMEAIVAGSDVAMVQLGRLYYQGLWGVLQANIGLALLERARALGNIDALLILAEIYQSKQSIFLDSGEIKPLYSIATTAKMLQEAGDTGYQVAQLAYARLYVNHDKGKHFNRRAYRWLRDIAVKTAQPQQAKGQQQALQAEALMLLGWVNARGLIAKQNFAQAKKYWLQAAERHVSPYILNEVAYTLVAIEVPELRDAPQALRLIEKLMTGEQDEETRRYYAYLDTWASAYAANGHFTRAIEIQRQAIQAIQEANTVPNKIEQEMLEAHLRAFHRGELIYDVKLY